MSLKFTQHNILILKLYKDFKIYLQNLNKIFKGKLNYHKKNKKKLKFKKNKKNKKTN